MDPNYDTYKLKYCTGRDYYVRHNIKDKDVKLCVLIRVQDEALICGIVQNADESYTV